MSVNIAYKQSSSPSRYLEPAGDGNIDVTQMAWTLTPISGRVEIPSMYLTEYQQNVGQLISSVIYYTKAAANVVNGKDGPITGSKSDADIYQYKYFAIPTGFSYRIPFFNPMKTSKTNDFSLENSQNPFRGLMDFTTKASIFKNSVIGAVAIGLDAAVGLADQLLPGKVNLELTKSWDNSTTSDYSVTWDLYNTGTLADISNNRNLAYILTYQNSPARRSAFIMDPPVIYNMYIPDIIAMPACYISSISIINLGNTREMNLNGVLRIIPEGYRFNLTFRSLLMDTRNIMNGLDTNTRLSAISDSSTLAQLTSDIANGNLSEDSYYSNPAAYDKAAANANKVDKQYGLPSGTALSKGQQASNFVKK